MTARVCAVECGRTAAPGQLMCRECWGLVPRHLQRAVYAAWRDFQNGRPGAAPAYRAARDAAIASVA